MTIPIRNLYYLFCYAWQRFPGGDDADVGIDDCPDLPNLFGRILVNDTNHLLRRGLDRGYLSYEQEMRSPRGRILIDRSIKEQTRHRGALYCQVDELSYDVLHNQIVKATASVLARHSSMAPRLAHELRELYHRMEAISVVRLEPRLFRRIQLFRNNAQYAAIMRLCEFVCRSQLPEEGGVTGRFADILRDEARMSQVFEDFLRNFYAYEQQRYIVAREDMRWRIEGEGQGDTSLIPIMRTDITLRSRSGTVVIDAKFYADPFPLSSGVPKLRSAHLYQLFAYMKHAHDRAAGLPVSGALIYAAPADGRTERYRLDGHDFLVSAVDLSRPWRNIHEDLMAILPALDSRRREERPPSLPPAPAIDSRARTHAASSH